MPISSRKLRDFPMTKLAPSCVPHWTLDSLRGPINQKKIITSDISPVNQPRFVPDPKEVASEVPEPKKPVIFFHPLTGEKLKFGGK